MTELETALRLAVATLAGMAVGLEREWSGHSTGPAARFAGVRTFALLGAIGGIAGWLTPDTGPALALGLLLGAAALIVAAYLVAARREPAAIDGTTEVAAILVLGIGLLAGQGLLSLASGAAAVVVLLLAEKQTFRAFVTRIGDREMRAALHFAVLALVVLPLLPAGPVETLGDIRPRELWIVVLIFSGLNFAGYLARRALGDVRGYPIMGALGGLVSSTAVTLTFARQSRKEPASAAALALGTLAGCTILIPRILGLTLILNRALLPAAALVLAPVFLVGIALILLRWRQLMAGTPAKAPPEAVNPLQLASAIKMVLAFQAVLWLLGSISRRFGENGVMASAALLGLTDMDALTFGMNRLATDAALTLTAAKALGLGVIVNSLFKAGLSSVLGHPTFRRLVLPALVALAAAGGIGIWLAGRLL